MEALEAFKNYGWAGIGVMLISLFIYMVRTGFPEWIKARKDAIAWQRDQREREVQINRDSLERVLKMIEQNQTNQREISQRVVQQLSDVYQVLGRTHNLLIVRVARSLDEQEKLRQELYRDVVDPMDGTD